MNAKIRTGFLAGSFSLLFLSACVSTTFTPYKDFKAGNLPPVSPTAVRVFTSIPDGGFRFLGEIDANMTGFPSDEAIIRKVRERAATIGADAIVFSLKGLGAVRAFRNVFFEPGVQRYGYGGPRMVSATFAAIRFLPEDSP